MPYYRAARLVALQTAVLRAAADDNLDTVIAYHSRALEAQACATSLPDVAAHLHRDDPKRHPELVWADGRFPQDATAEPWTPGAATAGRVEVGAVDLGFAAAGKWCWLFSRGIGAYARSRTARATHLRNTFGR